MPTGAAGAREFSFTQLLRRAAQTVGDRVVVDGEASFTWKQLAERSARLAGALQKLGMARGDRLAMLAYIRSDPLPLSGANKTISRRCGHPIGRADPVGSFNGQSKEKTWH